MTPPRDEQMAHQLQQQIKRRLGMRRGGMAWLLVTGGTVGLLFCVPIVGGAYLGRWLDMQIETFSTRWTVSLIVLGIALGGYNVYRFLRGLDK
ncbi:MAG TPA: AtpZ/AtpI family protein [Pseudomonadales bacterium]|nr:AtpZ/AtpI family protein [Pseudomonadales bacterium]